MTLVELGRSNHHCYSSPLAVVVVPVADVVHSQIHAGLAPDMMPVELALSSHRCLSFAHLKSIHKCCSDSAISIST